MDCHHPGAALQHVFEHVAAMKKNGVAKQWTRHNALADAPIKSDFFKVMFIIKYLFVILYCITIKKLSITTDKCNFIAIKFDEFN